MLFLDIIESWYQIIKKFIWVLKDIIQNNKGLKRLRL